MAGEDTVLRMVDGSTAVVTIEDNTRTYAIDEGTVAVGDVVYQVSGVDTKVAKADADNASARPPIGVCLSLPTSTTAIIVHSGGIASGLSGLTRGVSYWLSTTPGGLTSTRPSSNAYIVGVAISATSLVVCCVPADIAGGSGSGTITVKDEGVSVNTNFTTLNFTGYVSASDAGSGEATINIIGGSGGGGASGAINTVPTASQFPTTVLASGSVTNSTTALIFRANAHGASFDVQQILHAAPSSPWARYYRFEINPVQKQFLYGGFCIKNSTTGEFVLWSLIHVGTGLEGQYSQYSSTTSRFSFASGMAADPTSVYFKTEDNGTDFIISASPSGEAGTYVEVYRVGRTAFLSSYDLIGFSADAYNGNTPNQDCILAIQHYSASPPSYAVGSVGTADLAWVNLWDSVTDGLGSYTYAATATDVLVRCRMCGGGGGGGGGRLDTTAAVGSGGGGGSGAGVVEVYNIPSEANGWTATPGAAGTSGAKRTTTTGNGGVGGDGGASTWGPYRAPGGKGGAAGGPANSPTPGLSAYNVQNASRLLVNHPALTADGGPGGPGTASATQPVIGKGGAATLTGGAGGGAGGGIGTGTTAVPGAVGGDVGSTTGGAGGAGNANGNGTAGTAGPAVAGSVVGNGGGGGGNSGSGGVGASGGKGGPGSGGGGGGASHQTESGAGGEGGDGRVIVQVLRRVS